MGALDQDLQTPKNSLKEFSGLAMRVLNYLPAVVSDKKIKGKYVIFTSEIAGVKKFVRPINTELIITDEKDFKSYGTRFLNIINKLKHGKHNFENKDYYVFDRYLYTIQQMIGAGLDLLVNPNSARKHVGNRFEELIKTVFTEIGINNKRIVLQIPYETEDGQKIYRCENDMILSPFEQVNSTNQSIHEKEIVVAVKTTSKDRMGKIFIDKMLLERFVGHPQRIIGIFLNDVQRKESDNISFTLVSGLFMVYSKFLTQLDGVYYLDMPPNSLKSPLNQHMKPFSTLLLSDIWKLLTP